MPSAADQPDPRRMDEVLGEVKAAGLRRRRSRQRRRSLGALVGVVALATGLVVTLPDDGDVVQTDQASEALRRDLDRPAPDETASTRPTEVLGTVIEREADGSSEPPATEPPSPRPDGPATTAPPVTLAPPPTTAPSCVQSTDPACGPFRWDPSPAADQPLTLTPVDVVLAPGAETLLLVHWDDPDAALTFSDDDTDGSLVGSSCRNEPRYGPWTPPEPTPGTGTIERPYTAPAEPGTYRVTVYAATGTCDGYHPYRSEATTTVTVTVEA